MSLIVSPPALAGERRFACTLPHLPPAARAIQKLALDQCRWPAGEPGDADFAFCSETRIYHSRYCVTHARLARAGSRA